jgi:hypothetical protein
MREPYFGVTATLPGVLNTLALKVPIVLLVRSVRMKNKSVVEKPLARSSYQKPLLEHHPRFSIVTGTSLPIQTLIKTPEEK